jgi:hypothetical protein
MESPLIRISCGNTKIGNTGNVSLTPCASCPNDAPCKSTCYALKSYRMYKQVKSAWDSNLHYARNNRQGYFKQIGSYLTKKQPSFFRWHVAGDILDQDYLDNLVRLAKLSPNTKHLCFTKRYSLNFAAAKKVSNLSIVFSMWTNYGNTRKNMPRAWMLDPKDPDTRIPKDAIPCPGSCESCGMCWSLKQIGRDVVFHKH